MNYQAQSQGRDYYQCMGALRIFNLKNYQILIRDRRAYLLEQIFKGKTRKGRILYGMKRTKSDLLINSFFYKISNKRFSLKSYFRQLLINNNSFPSIFSSTIFWQYKNLSFLNPTDLSFLSLNSFLPYFNTIIDKRNLKQRFDLPINRRHQKSLTPSTKSHCISLIQYYTIPLDCPTIFNESLLNSKQFPLYTILLYRSIIINIESKLNPWMIAPQTLLHSTPTLPSAFKYKQVKDYLYNVEQMLGQGSFSIVYRAIQESTNQQLAIKVVKLSSLTFKKLEELLEQEIIIISSLKHPNIIRCVEVLKSTNHCYFITELCEGGNLQKTLRERGRLQQEEIWWMVRQIYQGLKYLSSKQIVHRDIKPANIFIKDGVVKIADFGFAIHSHQSFSDFSIGSPLYMSPEGYLRNCYGPKTDVWAFGIVIYQLLHGKQPLASCTRDEDLKINIAKNIRDDQFREHLSVEIKDFIKRCLEVDQAKRITIQEMERTPYFQRYANVRSMAEIRINQNDKRVSMPFIRDQVHETSLKSIQFTQRNTRLIPTNDKQNLRGKEYVRLPINILKPRAKKEVIKTCEIQQNNSILIDSPFKDVLKGSLTFNQSIGLIHYCRIGYKLCQQPIEETLATSIKSLILKILSEIQIKVNLGHVKYDQQQNRAKKQSKLKLILHEYQIKYQKQLRGDKVQIDLQMFSGRVTKEFQRIQENMDSALRRCYLTMIFQIFTKKLMESIGSNTFNIFGEIGLIDTCLDDRAMPKCLNDYTLAKLKYSSYQK